jgi:glucose-6-phosphate 1-dehydrogenase
LDEKHLFPSDEEILGSWKIYQKIVCKWRNNGDAMFQYKKGEEMEKNLNLLNKI